MLSWLDENTLKNVYFLLAIPLILFLVWIIASFLVIRASIKEK